MCGGVCCVLLHQELSICMGVRVVYMYEEGDNILLQYIVHRVDRLVTMLYKIKYSNNGDMIP